MSDREYQGTVRVDSSWADTLPPCVECGQDVPWPDALLMPCARYDDGDVEAVGIVHAKGCPTQEAAVCQGWLEDRAQERAA